VKPYFQDAAVTIYEKYAEIAAKRMEQEMLPLSFEPTPHPQPELALQ